jgi:hypothetical protein
VFIVHDVFRPLILFEMEEYRFKFARKHIQCPYCLINGKFKPYIDSLTEEQLPDKYGKCERVESCGMWVKPWEDGFTKIWLRERTHQGPYRSYVRSKPTPVYIPKETLLETLSADRYAKNIFIQTLLENVTYPFEVEEIERVVAMYRLGTVASGYMAGATTFPFIDINGNVCAIQVKKFDQFNHTLGSPIPIHRLIQLFHKKKGTSIPDWLEEYIKQNKVFTCNFGEHLLRMYPNNPVGLVESPKTAIYATLYFGFPDNPKNKIWIAPGSRDWFNIDRIKVLQGRDVYVYPDLSKDGSTHQSWREKSWKFERLMPGTFFQVDNLLERHASLQARYAGHDMADVLIKLDPKEFRKLQTAEPSTSIIKEELNPISKDPSKPYDFSDPGWDLVYDPVDIDLHDTTKDQLYPNFVHGAWTNQIKEIDSFLMTLHSVDVPFNYSKSMSGSSIRTFLYATLEVARKQNGNPAYRQYLNRAIELIRHLKKDITKIT